jgi:hypothetical protein
MKCSSKLNVQLLKIPHPPCLFENFLHRIWSIERENRAMHRFRASLQYNILVRNVVVIAFRIWLIHSTQVFPIAWTTTLWVVGASDGPKQRLFKNLSQSWLLLYYCTSASTTTSTSSSTLYCSHQFTIYWDQSSHAYGEVLEYHSLDRNVIPFVLFRIYAIDPCIYCMHGLAHWIIKTKDKDTHKKHHHGEVTELKMKTTGGPEPTEQQRQWPHLKSHCTAERGAEATETATGAITKGPLSMMILSFSCCCHHCM